MSCKTQDALVANAPKKEIYSFEKAMKEVKFDHCGENVGSFSFSDEDLLTIPTLDKLFVRARDKVLRKQPVTILSITAQVNNGWEFVPVWALRKTTRSKADLPDECLQNELYMELYRCQNDLERIRLLAGRTFKIKEVIVTQVNPDTNVEYPTSIYLLVEVKPDENKG